MRPFGSWGTIASYELGAIVGCIFIGAVFWTGAMLLLPAIAAGIVIAAVVGLGINVLDKAAGHLEGTIQETKNTTMNLITGAAVVGLLTTVAVVGPDNSSNTPVALVAQNVSEADDEIVEEEIQQPAKQSKEQPSENEESLSEDCDSLNLTPEEKANSGRNEYIVDQKGCKTVYGSLSGFWNIEFQPMFEDGTGCQIIFDSPVVHHWSFNERIRENLWEAKGGNLGTDIRRIEFLESGLILYEDNLNDDECDLEYFELERVSNNSNIGVDNSDSKNDHSEKEEDDFITTSEESSNTGRNKYQYQGYTCSKSSAIPSKIENEYWEISFHEESNRDNDYVILRFAPGDKGFVRGNRFQENVWGAGNWEVHFMNGGFTYTRNQSDGICDYNFLKD